MSWGEADPATWPLEPVVPIAQDQFDDALPHRIRTDLIYALDDAPEPMHGALLRCFSQPTVLADRPFMALEAFYAHLLMQLQRDWNQGQLVLCLRDLVVRETLSRHLGHTIPVVTRMRPHYTDAVGEPMVLHWTIVAMSSTIVTARHDGVTARFVFMMGAYEAEFLGLHTLWRLDDLGPLVLERWRSVTAQAAAEELQGVWPPELIPWVVQYLTTASIEENQRLVSGNKRRREE